MNFFDEFVIGIINIGYVLICFRERVIIYEIYGFK